jgi:hypothetical protein
MNPLEQIDEVRGGHKAEPPLRVIYNDTTGQGGSPVNRAGGLVSGQ